jgi:hypothetical protein
LRNLARVCLGAAVAVAVGCSSDDTPTGGAGGRAIKASPSFANDIQEIFSRRGCTASQCHGAAVSQGLDLRVGAAYDSLVNVTSTEDPTKKRVLPGNAQDSYIVIKVEGRQSVGAQMPAGLAPLDSIDLANLRNWIDQNAPDN